MYYKATLRCQTIHCTLGDYLSVYNIYVLKSTDQLKSEMHLCCTGLFWPSVQNCLCHLYFLISLAITVNMYFTEFTTFFSENCQDFPHCVLKFLKIRGGRTLWRNKEKKMFSFLIPQKNRIEKCRCALKSVSGNIDFQGSCGLRSTEKLPFHAILDFGNFFALNGP